MNLNLVRICSHTSDSHQLPSPPPGQCGPHTKIINHKCRISTRSKKIQDNEVLMFKIYFAGCMFYFLSQLTMGRDVILRVIFYVVVITPVVFYEVRN